MIISHVQNIIKTNPAGRRSDSPANHAAKPQNTPGEFIQSGTVDSDGYQIFGRFALFALLIPLFLLASCGPATETVVVDREARAADPEEEDVEVPEDVEGVLKIGESNKIRSMDPLFALNTAAQRAVQLTYEGLVRYDEHDDIVPAVAKRWDVSDDSLIYTFHLRENLYFHDDESFSQGRGRRLNSSDVVRIFERMASRNVPENAAELFMDAITGFEAFYLEQREVYFEEYREITEISGLEAIDEHTVRFRLLEPDSHFLKKLATPFAVIYPHEPFRFRDDGLHQHAVGSGPFEFDTAIGDSIFVFLRNDEYYRKDEQGRSLPGLQRIELMNVTDESRLYSHFTRERLDMIAEPGPYVTANMVNSDNRLKQEMGERYRLKVLPNPDPIILRYNDKNRFELDRSDAAAVIRNVGMDSIRQNLNHPSLSIAYKDTNYSQANVGRIFRRFDRDSEHRLVFAFNRDHLPRLLSGSIYEIMDDNLEIDLVQRGVFSRDIFLYLDYLHTYIPGMQHEAQPQEILRFESDRYMIFRPQVEGIRTNSLSWWIDLNHVRISRDNTVQRIMPAP